MAQHFTDFSTDTIGQLPAGWSRMFTTTGTFAVQSIGGGVNVLRYSGSSSTGARRGIAWTGLGSFSGTVQLYAKFRYTGTGNTNAAMLFMSGSAGNENGLATQFGADPGDGNRFLARYANGTPSALDTHAGEFPTNGWWNVVLNRASNGVLQTKYWLDGSPEPTGWNMSSSSAGSPTSGFVGLTANSLGGTGQAIEWAAFGVGTGGDPAPRENPVTIIEPGGSAGVDAAGDLDAVEIEAPVYFVAFMPDDLLSTNAGELLWGIYTEPNAGGTMLASGTATAGEDQIVYVYEDDDLVNGENTRYLYLIDGANNSLDQPFTVKMVFAVDVEMDGTAAVDTAGNLVVEAEFTTAGTDAVDAEGHAEIAATIPQDGAAGVDADGAVRIVFDLTGTAAVDAEGALDVTPLYYIPVTGDAGVDAEGSLVVFYVSAQGGTAEVDADGTITLTADVPMPGEPVVDADGAVTIRPTIDDQAVTVEAGGETVIAPRLTGEAGADAEADMHIDADAPMPGEPAIDADGELALTAQFAADAPVDAGGDIAVELIGHEVRGYRIRADFLTTAGEPIGAGPVTNIEQAAYELTLDEVGTFEMSIPADTPAANEIVAGSEVRLYRESEGEVFRGVVHTPKIVVPESGKHELQIAGDSVARELVWANTLFGRIFSNTPLSSAVNTLLAGTGWIATTDHDPTRNLTANYDAASVWRAVAHAAETFGWHVRENNLERTIEVGKFGQPSGLIFQNVTHVEDDMGVIPIRSIELTSEQADLWNSVIPVGAGEGINVLTLQHSTRTGPYPIQTGTGPDGRPYWFIEDTASVQQHGRRIMPLSIEDVIPHSNSIAELRNAANALYDITAAWLSWHATPYQVYEIEISGLRHYADGVPRFKLGDTARLVYRGLATDADGETIVWQDIDANVYILGARRTFNADEIDGWTLALGTTDRPTPSDADVIARAIDDLWAVQTAKRPYSYREVHGPYVQSIDPSTSARYLIDFDANVAQLHQAVLRVRRTAVKSNVAGAAAGGGQTAQSVGNHTHAIDAQVSQGGGGQTSSGGSPHSHSVSGQTAQSGGGHTSGTGSAHSHTVPAQTIFSSGAHWHMWGQAQSTQTWNEPVVYKQQIVTERSNAQSFGFYVRRDGPDGSTNALYTRSGDGAHIHNITQETTVSEASHRHAVLNHQHSVSVTTSNSEASHTHTVQNHTHQIRATTTVGGGAHSHEIADHVHALVYGIYTGPNPNAPFLRVWINGTDRTSALDGPWNGNFTVDITRFLVDANGQVLRGANDIDISGSQLCDVEVTVKSLVSATSVVPV